jgi:hypothetical protein
VAPTVVRLLDPPDRHQGRREEAPATGVSHGKAIPFLPILQLCPAFFGIADQDSDTRARERIAGRLLLLDESFRESLPLMFDFLGVPDPELPVPRMDPEARQRQIFAVPRRDPGARPA